MFDDFRNHFRMKHFTDKIMRLRMFVVPFFAFMLGLVHHVFHLLVEVQHFQIESEQAFLLVNQWELMTMEERMTEKTMFLTNMAVSKSGM